MYFAKYQNIATAWSGEAIWRKKSARGRAAKGASSLSPRKPSTSSLSFASANRLRASAQASSNDK